MKSTQFRVDDVFGDVFDKDSISTEQIFEISIILSKMVYKYF